MNRYTFDDYRAGKCTEYEVGTTIPPGMFDTSDPPDPTIEDEAEHVTGDVLRRALKAFHDDPEAFMVKTPSIVNKLLELDAKALVAERDAAPIKDKDVDRMTTAQLCCALLEYCKEFVPPERQAAFDSGIGGFLRSYIAKGIAGLPSSRVRR